MSAGEASEGGIEPASTSRDRGPDRDGEPRREHEHEPLRALAGAARDVDPIVAAEVQRQARAILRIGRERSPYLAWGMTVWSRVVVPMVLLGVVGSYLSLAVQAATAPYR